VVRKQGSHKFCVILRRASLAHLHIPKPGVRLKGKKDATGPILLIFIMLAFRFAGTQRQDRSPLFNQRTGSFSETEERMARVIRQLILVQHVFHMPQIVTGNLAYAPLL
jgi:hypothetical protein